MNLFTVLALVDAAIALAEKIPAALDALKRTEELTAEQRAALEDRIAKLKTLPHWKV